MRVFASSTGQNRRPLAVVLAVAVALLTIQVVSVKRAAAAAGDITTIAGTGSAGYSGDAGPATAAQLNQPIDAVQDAAGNTYVADLGNAVVRKIDTSGVISTFAGNGTAGFSGDGGPATAAQLNQPFGLLADSGNLYIADQGTNVNRIRVVNLSTGIISEVAGNGSLTPSGEGGPATSAGIGQPQFMVKTSAGFFFTDDVNNRVMKIDSGGILTTYASGISVALGLGADPSGNLYATSFNGNVVDKIDTSGTITVVAGGGTGGDGGPATSAQLNGPYDVKVAGGSLFISEFYGQDVRRVDGTGTISTIAGTGIPGYSGDGGPATAAQLKNPTGLSFSNSAAGDLLIADYSNNAVRRVETAAPLDLLSLSGSSSPNPQIGQPLTYSLTVTNPGAVGPATGVVLTDTIPGGVTFAAASSSQGTCARSASTVTCAIGSLAAFATASVTITVTPTSSLLLTDTASVVANETDPYAVDNAITLLSGTTTANLALSFTHLPTILPPAPFTASATVTNTGPNAATGVGLTLAIPVGATVAAVGRQHTCTTSPPRLSCPIGGLAAGAAATITLQVTPTLGSFKFSFTAVEDQFPGGTVGGFTVATGCGAIVTQSATFSADLGPCPGTGITVAASNVVVNLNGHHVQGSGTTPGFSTNPGVYIPYLTGVTVENGTVSGFDGGVEIIGGGKNVVTNMVVRDNIGDATQGRGPIGGGPQGNPNLAIIGDGILVADSPLNQITNNAVIHNGPFDGIGVLGPDSDSNLVQRNTVQNTVTDSRSGDGEGILVRPIFFPNEPRTPPISHDDVVSNTVSGSAASGISISSDDNANVLNNVVSSNGLTGTPGNGIDVGALPGYGPPSTADLIKSNTISGSGADGILITSNGNTIKANTATADNALNGGSFDLHDANAACGSNRWVSNNYGAALFLPSCAATGGTRV